MIKLGLIALIGISLFLARKNITNGIVGIGFLACLVLFVMFMFDRFSVVPVREYVNMDKYDETIANPTGVIGDIGEGIYEKGKEVGTTILDKGDELDEYYGTTIGEETEEKDTDKANKKEKDSSKEINNSQPSSSTSNTSNKDNIVLDKNQYFYADIEKDLTTTLAKLTNREKALVRSLQPLFKIEYTTENVIIRSTGDKLTYEIVPVTKK